MSLSGSRLQGALQTDILAQLQSQFPVNGSLLPGEIAQINAAQQKLATALATATGPDVVTEVLQATVQVASVSGVTSGPSSSGPGTGTLL